MQGYVSGHCEAQKYKWGKGKLIVSMLNLHKYYFMSGMSIAINWLYT